MLAGLPFKGDHDPKHRNGDFLNARHDRGSSDVMGALAKCAILMCKTVQMDVSELDCGAKEQKDSDDGNEQKTHPRVLCPKFADSPHNYSQYISAY
jgi:hypothetical protein